MVLQRAKVALAVGGLLLATMLVLRPTGAAFTGSAVTSGSSAAAAQLTAAGGLTATGGCSGLTTRWVSLQWTSSPSGPTTRYRVYRSVGGGAFASLTTVAHGADPHSHVDSGLATGTAYSYYVIAERGGTTWSAAASNTASATTHGTLCAGA